MIWHWYRIVLLVQTEMYPWPNHFNFTSSGSDYEFNAKSALLFSQFKLISQAYEVLADEKKRKVYDEGGEEAIKGGGSGEGFHSPFDIFDMFFGGHSRRQQGERHGKDMFHQLKVSESYKPQIPPPCRNKLNSKVITSQKWFFWNYGVYSIVWNNLPEKSSQAKKMALMFKLLHTKLSLCSACSWS